MIDRWDGKPTQLDLFPNDHRLYVMRAPEGVDHEAIRGTQRRLNEIANEKPDTIVIVDYGAEGIATSIYGMQPTVERQVWMLTRALHILNR